MKVLGCTGGIGSGKSYVSSIFNKMGIPVYDSDYRAKSLYDTDIELQKKMIALLGSDIILDGVVQRKVIADKIFKNKELLAEVEKLVHPAVVADFYNWKNGCMLEAVKSGEEIPFVIIESAILLEKPVVKSVADKILTVSAPLELRIERVMKRDGVDRVRVLGRMAAQWSDRDRETISDFVIYADGKQPLLPQVWSVLEAMKNSYTFSIP